MKKKIVTVALVVALLAVAVIGGTIAYFTDNKEATNTFTMGSVSIELLESQYHRVNAGKGNATGAVEPTTGGYLWAADVELAGNEENTPDAANSGWSGAYFSDEQIIEDAASYKDGYFAEKSEKMVPGSNVRKNPYVLNTGANAAYIRVKALVPVSLFKVLDYGPSYWVDSALKNGVTSKAVAAYMANRDSFMNGTATAFIETVGGIDYYVFDFTYDEPLEPGALTFWNVWGNIAIDEEATQADFEDVESFDVIFRAEAIQADTFANAADAFAAFDA